MFIDHYTCTLLSDIIVTSSAATEGFSPSLDYIPGSKFLGMVAAKLYDCSSPEQTLDLFHNGVVQFGEASPVLNEAPLLRIPFSWHHPKGISLEKQLITDRRSINSPVQLEQARKGYFNPTNFESFQLKTRFSLKSAYDSKLRKSEEGKMFGYFSLTKDSTWGFEVRSNNEHYLSMIQDALQGVQRLGRSRTAEYGLVNIEKKQRTNTEVFPIQGTELKLYAKSNWCFYDNFSATTLNPSTYQLCGQENATIDWSQTFIRTRNYKLWNRHRNYYDADRIIIERGSVITLKLQQTIDPSWFIDGIGSFRNEGFGQVLLNPPFLYTESTPKHLVKSTSEDLQSTKAAILSEKDQRMIELLKKKQTSSLKIEEIENRVNFFKKNQRGHFNHITSSQWGILRNYATNINKLDDFYNSVFQKDYGFMYKGQSEVDWAKKSCRQLLEDELLFMKNEKDDNNLTKFNESDILSFFVRLANQMSKK